MNKKIKKVLSLVICLVIIMFSNSYATNIVTNSYSNNTLNTNSSNTYSNSTYTNTTTSQTAKKTTPVVDETKKIYDYANLITDEEETELYNKVQEFINKYNMDMVIVTINSNPKSSSMAYADDFYDYNNFGKGANKSGLLFLIDMQNRKMWISTTGDAIKIYTDSRINTILDYTYDEISNKDYNGCAEQFIDKASYFANKGLTGGSKVVTVPKMICNSLIFAGIATIVLICIGLATHRKPRKKKEASNYITQPLKLSKNSDTFVNKHVSKVKIETSSSSGGSSTHRSSSGRSHGGGGRSF